MSQSETRSCPHCGAPLAMTARYCSRCGQSVGADLEPDEVLLAHGKRLRVSPDALSIRELLAMVESGVYWWQQKLQDAEGVNRERAAAALKELSTILDSLSRQLAQGRETVRITSRLPTLRSYPAACPVCGRGNRSNARFCVACGSLLSGKGKAAAPPHPPPPPKVAVAAQTDRGMARANNEDTFYTGTLSVADKPLATLLIVADGMGGAQAGEEASRLATETVKQEVVRRLQLQQPVTSDEWQAMLRAAATAANQRVYSQAHARSEQRGMGTTLTVALVAGRSVHLAHVGDTRAYLLNAGGVTEDGAKLTPLTSDHSLVARLVDIGQLTPEQARTHPNRNMLYRSLGTDPTVEVDTASQPLEAGDMLLLCSDGLTTYLEDSELAQVALSDLSLKEMCERLIARANARGGKDNITVVIAKMRD